MSENEYLVESEDLFEGWSQEEPVNELVCAGLSQCTGIDLQSSPKVQVEDDFVPRDFKSNTFRSWQLASMAENPPESLPAFQAVQWQDGTCGINGNPRKA